MGGRYSSQPPPPSPLLRELWREVNWEEPEKDLQYVRDYKPRVEGRQLRILLYGSVRAGKSSFINSVDSVLQGRMCIQAGVDNFSHDSFTREYHTYTFKKGEDDVCSFVINDIRGLEHGSNRSRRVQVKDTKRVMQGHVRDGYTMISERKISKGDRHYIRSPTVNDRVHILVCVAEAGTVSLMDNKVLETIQDIREDAADLRIPHVAILTKIDKICPEIQKDIKNVFKSKTVKKAMEMLGADVGVQENCIFPVKNYSSENVLNNKTNALILNALRHIIDSGNDFLERIPSEQN